MYTEETEDWFDEWYWTVWCIKEHGRILKGECAHFCLNWDGLTVDETTPEFISCGCLLVQYSR